MMATAAATRLSMFNMKQARAPLVLTTGPMMAHRASVADLDFRRRFESCLVPLAAFDHRSHLRLAYVYLCEQDVAAAAVSMRAALKRFLAAHGLPEAKYHETMTVAWLRAVGHFMGKTAAVHSAEAFIASNPALLDPDIMLTHYSAVTLFSDAARGEFTAPDLDPIPPAR